jgi:undecaprenyl-diphosphatase
MMGIKAFLSLIFAYTVSLLLKYYFHITMPYESLENLTIIEQQSSHSFPSSHTTVAFAASETSPVYKNFLRIWAVIIALSRVVLGVHFITDVIAGALLGILVSHLFARWDMGRFVTKFKKN